jgi:hypothetical protein
MQSGSHRKYPVIRPPRYPLVASKRQLGILLLDHSLSMTWPGPAGTPKYLTATAAARDLFQRLSSGKRAADFWGSIIAFHSMADILFPPTPVIQISDNLTFTRLDDPDYEPEGTVIASGLEAAEQMVNAFLAPLPEGKEQPLHSSSVIVLMTDGRDGEYPGPDGSILFDPSPSLAVAERLKQSRAAQEGRLTLCATYFATANDPAGVREEAEGVLRRLVTDPVRDYRTTHTREELRQFFLGSITDVA